MASLLLVVKWVELDRHNAEVMATIARETADSDEPIAYSRGASPAGHEQKLRGIPVVGCRGLGGAIKGTKPHVDGIRD